MKIEFLFFDGCPNHKPALDLLQKILEEEGIDAPVETINVISDEMAKKVRFPGSPSIRIKGKDIDTEAGDLQQDFGIKCRVYIVDGKFSGIPPRELIRNAIKEVLS